MQGVLLLKLSFFTQSLVVFYLFFLCVKWMFFYARLRAEKVHSVAQKKAHFGLQRACSEVHTNTHTRACINTHSVATRERPATEGGEGGARENPLTVSLQQSLKHTTTCTFQPKINNLDTHTQRQRGRECVK